MRLLNFTLAKYHQIATLLALGSYTFLSLSFNFRKNTNKLKLGELKQGGEIDAEKRFQSIGKKVIL